MKRGRRNKGNQRWDADPNLIDHYVYRAFDADGRLLYVGCSKDVTARVRGHRAAADWLPYMDRLDVEGPFTYADARDRESAAIESEGSFFNITLARKRARDQRRLAVAAAFPSFFMSSAAETKRAAEWLAEHFPLISELDEYLTARSAAA